MEAKPPLHGLPKRTISGHWLPQKTCCSLSDSPAASWDHKDFVQASEVWSTGLLHEAWTPQTDSREPLNPIKCPGAILTNGDDLFYHIPSPANPKKGKPKYFNRELNYLTQAFDSARLSS